MKQRTWAVLGLLIALPMFAVAEPILMVVNSSVFGFTGLEFNGRTYSGTFVEGDFNTLFPDNGSGGRTGAPFLDDAVAASGFADSVVDLINSDGTAFAVRPVGAPNRASFDIPLTSLTSTMTTMIGNLTANITITDISFRALAFNGTTLSSSGTPTSRLPATGTFLLATDTGAAAAAVPEPSTFALLFFATGALVIGKRRFPKAEEGDD